MIISDALYDGLCRFLLNIADNTGDVINEYHWREACGLLKELELNNRTDEEETNNTTNDQLFKRTWGGGKDML